jgi:hypothetical protein
VESPPAFSSGEAEAELEPEIGSIAVEALFV